MLRRGRRFATGSLDSSSRRWLGRKYLPLRNLCPYALDTFASRPIYIVMHFASSKHLTPHKHGHMQRHFILSCARPKIHGYIKVRAGKICLQLGMKGSKMSDIAERWFLRGLFIGSLYWTRSCLLQNAVLTLYLNST